MHTTPLSDDDRTTLSTHRLQALQDGVFAIVMTILVLEFHLPEGSAATLQADLWHLWPVFIVYIVSFINLGIYWTGQNLQYHFIEATDRPHTWINIAFLMFVSVIPFTASLLGEYPNEQLPVVLYGINQIILGLLSAGGWIYATKHHRLTSHSINDELVRRVRRRILVAPCVAFIAIIVSFWYPRLSDFLYIILMPYYVIPSAIDKFWYRPAVPHTHDHA